MKNYVVCFDYHYDNTFIKVDASSEKEAIEKAKDLYSNNYGSGNLSRCNIDAQEV